MEKFSKGEEVLCDIILEFYTYFKAIENELNPYYDFYKYLSIKHPNLSKRKILEVASGYIPAMSYLITMNEKMENIITTMDPKRLPIKIKGVHQKRKEFTSETNINQFDLVFAHCPCECFEILLKKTVEEKKEFSIQTCQCGVGNGFYFYNRRDWLYYIDSFFYQASSLEDDGFIVEKEYLDLSYQMDAPIITARKRTLNL